ncbi:MAG TPA: TM0106 family RecB-like putative nuclease [Polyangiaceae bacterium]|nr:TM0106 family RecB-like putative nuclease [Polyangiaceae bacterium]
MHFSSSGLILTATDLGAFSECSHRTLLDLGVALGTHERPHGNDLERQMLERRGREHEARVLEHYRASGRSVVVITDAPTASVEAHEQAARATERALRDGADVIYQGVLFDGAWLGRPDFLVKVPRPSRFGAYGYEVVDAKLSREEKARAVLQLCVYTDHLARVQGALPEHFWMALGGDDPRPKPLRAANYLAYYRSLRGRFEGFARADAPAEPYPEPVEHCDVCPWWKRCEERRRGDDHLSLVAGITRKQRERLATAGIARVEALAALPEGAAIDGIGAEALSRLERQARLQVASRREARALYELFVGFEPGTGLESLPKPTPGDLFLDLEGDPFVRGSGLEFLFGLVELGEPSDDFFSRTEPGPPRYHAFWATNPAEEKRAFEAVIDRILRGLEEFQDLHVFHFGHRENEALKVLSCRHHTREDAVDLLLRRHVLVDLHRVVKHALTASVEAYTLKELERLTGFERRTPLREAARALQHFGFWLETGEALSPDDGLRATIATYNEDDCLSALRLRDFLEARREELAAQLDRPLARPVHEEKAVSAEREKASEKTARLAARLTAGLPEDPAHDDEEQAAKRLLASLLDWHWREAKSGYWEYFRTLELPRDERLEDRAVLAELRFVGDLGPEKQSRIHRYEFPEQEHSIRRGDKPVDPDTRKSAGEVVALGGTFIDLKRNPAHPHPSALVRPGPPDTDHQRARLLEIGTLIADQGVRDGASAALARALLLRTPPRCGQPEGAPLLDPGADTVHGIAELALRLAGEGGVLAVQGPPGSGKTHRAAFMIAELVRAGKRVGVTANSHKVIGSLLARAVAAGTQAGVAMRATHITKSGDEDPETGVELEKDHRRALSRLEAGDVHVVGGTAWAWSREELEGSVDVLVVDEASQMSLANVIAISLAASTLVLFGDPAQLDQPQKGVHPEGADRSALEHLLGDALTLPPERGVFLAETRRLHPDICAFTSAVFYDGRLSPIDGLDEQRILGPGLFDGSGLRFVPVEHTGNTNRSDEEVERIAALIETLLAAGARVREANGNERPLTEKDVLVVAPYNAQVAALQRRLPCPENVGTVDKFQGQQAPIVIYSMTSSSAEDAPRGMEFLYSLNRLNVATSRAQALVVLVASPSLFSARCRTPRQMRLANALCTYLEHARRG